MFTVTISEKGGQQSKYDFSKPEIIIGRMKGNDIVLPKGNVSKQHTRILLRDNAFFISDMKSTNGTYVNGRKVAGEQGITEADKIYIGDFILQLEKMVAGAKPPKAPPSPPRAPMPQGDNRQTLLGQSSPENMPPHPPHDSATVDFDAAELDLSPPTPSSPSKAGRPPMVTEPSLGEPVDEPDEDASITGSDVGASRPLSPGPTASLGAVRGSNSRAAAMLQRPPLESEFDLDFHAAQFDVAHVLFEKISAIDLPLFYPPESADRASFENQVEEAVTTVAPGVDHDQLIDSMTTECVGLGPIEMYLDDPEVRDIYVNRYDSILVRKNGRLTVAERAFSHPEFLIAAAHRLLGAREVAVGADEVRFNDGTRVHIVMPPLAVAGPVLTIRKPATHQPDLAELVVNGSLSATMADFLSRAVEAGRSIVVAGPTSSGKTTLLAALARTIPPGARVITVEQSSQLALEQEGAVRLEATAASGFDMRYLIRSAVSMHPQRIIVDECRGAEAYDWVTSAAAGTEGSMISIHGTSAPDALGRIESLSLLGSSDISPRGLREQIARACNLVVVVNNNNDGGFRVQQITEVQGVDLDAFRLNDVFYYRVEGTEGAFHPTGYIPLFYEDLRHAGADVDFGVFRE